MPGHNVSEAMDEVMEDVKIEVVLSTGESSIDDADIRHLCGRIRPWCVYLEDSLKFRSRVERLQ